MSHALIRRLDIIPSPAARLRLFLRSIQFKTQFVQFIDGVHFETQVPPSVYINDLRLTIRDFFASLCQVPSQSLPEHSWQIARLPVGQGGLGSTP